MSGYTLNLTCIADGGMRALDKDVELCPVPVGQRHIRLEPLPLLRVKVHILSRVRRTIRVGGRFGSAVEEWLSTNPPSSSLRSTTAAVAPELQVDNEAVTDGRTIEIVGEKKEECVYLMEQALLRGTG